MIAPRREEGGGTNHLKSDAAKATKNEPGREGDNK